MTDALPVFYWDACVMTSYIEDNPDRAPLIELLLADARSGDLEIVTSAISQVEVAYATSERAQTVIEDDPNDKQTLI